jgi:ferritin
MIGQKMQNAMNEQIKHETFSAYLYAAMAADFHAKGLDGMAQWMKAQAHEELGHALRFFNHINDRGGRIELQAIDKPQKEWSSPLQAFEAALEHERFITGRIDELARLADEENDRAAGIVLQWFVTEQVEEEDSVAKVIDLLKVAGEKGPGLLMADRELGQRVAAPFPPTYQFPGEVQQAA